jgi:glycosyltransferase involved in cell wall biosynthesis
MDRDGVHGGPVTLERLTLVTDAWHPQTNGVVRTLSKLVAALQDWGVEVLVLSPAQHRTAPLPSYPEIQLACDPWTAAPRLHAFRPDAVHVATEGPLGVWMRGHLVRRGLRFTTSFHTRFPEYVSARLPVPLSWGYGFERWFHSRAEHTLVGTRTLIRELEERHVGKRLVHWPRGVDTALFHPGHAREAVYANLPRPIWLYVGRLAVEKSLGDFLRLPLSGTKVVVGDGPQGKDLQRRYRDVVFRGWRHGQELAEHYASADFFVFPSRTETFGNVLLEAMASGLPVVAFPGPGPSDLIEDGVTGAVGDDLFESCLRAHAASRVAARASALRHSWSTSVSVFHAHLVTLDQGRPFQPAYQSAAAS